MTLTVEEIVENGLCIRRLSASVVAHVGAGLRDDATLFLVEYTNHDPVNPGLDTTC